MQAFDLKLLNQPWFEGQTDSNAMPWDTTSHENIRLVINGEDISGCELPDNELGINQSAVALLQSVFTDHELDENYPMFFHGCWILGTCPNRIIDFRVIHGKNDVTLDHFIITGIDDSKKHYEKRAVIANKEYANQILDFAREAFKILTPKRGDLDYEADAYISLKKEHEELISMVVEYLNIGTITDKMKNRARSFKL
jgi:hypothetical protein